jgi:hypothetical protein
LTAWAAAAARGRPVRRLQVLGDVAVGARMNALVPIGQIIGSVGPSLNFDACFRPTSQLPRARFERIAASVRRGCGSEPVELYRRRDGYFVQDGHHRIAVARALGQREVWAAVIDVCDTGLPGSSATPWPA